MTLTTSPAALTHRARLEGEAVIAAVGAAQPDVVADAARALLQHAFERRRKAVAIERMENIEPASRPGPSSAPRLRPSWDSISPLT